MADNTVDHNLDYEASAANIFFFTCVMGISLWNASEVILVTYLKYRHLRTLYFWSIMSSATGVIMCTLSQIINILVVGRSNLVPAALGSLGWIPMVTGQSLVLYSRLHLLYIDAWILRLVLSMIIVDGITFHVTGVVLIMGSNSNHPGPYLMPYSVLEKLQVTAFFIQETVLSSLYLWACYKFLRGHIHGFTNFREKRIHKVKGILRALILMTSIIMILDIAIPVLEYLGLYIFQLSGKNFLYSVKLKIELGVLDQLKDFVKYTRTLEPSLRALDEVEQRRHLEIQWEAALQRAFGSSSHISGRNRPTESGDGTQQSPGHISTIQNHRNADHASTATEPPQYFNIEVLYTSTVQRFSSAEESRSGREGR